MSWLDDGLDWVFQSFKLNQLPFIYYEKQLGSNPESIKFRVNLPNQAKFNNQVSS